MSRVKYKERKDGKGKETTKTYDGVRKHFYGKTDEEIDAKIDAFVSLVNNLFTLFNYF